MKILFRLVGLALICFLTVYIVSCGQRDEDDEVSPVDWCVQIQVLIVHWSPNLNWNPLLNPLSRMEWF